MKFDSEESLLRKFLEGSNKIENAVGSTLGPRGRNFIFRSPKQNSGKPVITKDGVTVAKFMESEDPMEDLAMQVIKQASIETNKAAGDGTTTSTVISCNIVREGVKNISNGSSPIDIQRGIQLCVDQVLEKLDDMSFPLSDIDDIRNIATIAANNDEEIGKIIAEAVHKTGKDGKVVVERGKNHKIELEFRDGFVFNSGFASNQFINVSGKAEVYFENPFILVTSHVIDDVKKLIEVFKMVDRDERPFVIIADEVRGEALANIIVNNSKGRPVAVLNPPGFGRERKEMLKDIAVACGARFISAQNRDDLTKVRLKDMGTCEKLRATKYSTTLYETKGDPELIQERIELIKDMVDQETDAKVGEKLAQRAAKLSSSLAVVKSGGATEAESIERKYRIEDALEAIKSAQEDNIVIGGGRALFLVAEDLEMPNFKTKDEEIGWSIMKKALRSPFDKIAENAGKNTFEVLGDIDHFKHRLFDQMDDWKYFGYDFKNNEVVNMKTEGIIDPLKVTKNAVKNGASAAGVLLTAKCAAVKES